MKINKILLILMLTMLTGCFKVGRMPFTTQNGPTYENTKSAILIPKGSQTQILMVNNETVKSDFVDRLANLSLKPLLMYLEPQVFVKPGETYVTVRAVTQDETNYGTTTVTTTTWKDYRVSKVLRSGKKYSVTADLYSGAQILEIEEDIDLASNK